MSELFECRNCLHVGPLTVRGECEACGSASVISQEVLSILPYGLKVFSDRQPIRSKDVYGHMGLA